MTLKVLTLNIFEGGLFLPQVIELIKRENPDIFCLQEVYNGFQVTLPQCYQSITTLQTTFPAYQYHFSPEFLSATVEGSIDVGNATFSRFPILETNTHFFKVKYGEYSQVSPSNDYSDYPCNMQHTVVNVEDKHFHIFNVHGVWGVDGNDNPDRLYMSKVISKAIKGKKPAVLVGDFNVQPNTKTINNIKKQMIDVFEDELTTTFNLRHKDLEKYPGYASAVVDMMFVTQDLTVISKSVPDDDVSDHLPLLCELEM